MVSTFNPTNNVFEDEEQVSFTTTPNPNAEFDCTFDTPLDETEEPLPTSFNDEEESQGFDGAWEEEAATDYNGCRVNVTGLVLYKTTTATKVSYWKRRLGWKPNMARTQCKKFKSFVRSPVRKRDSTGAYKLKGADGFYIKTCRKSQSRSSTKSVRGSHDDKQWNPDEEYVVDNDGTLDGHALGAVDHELVFA